MTVYNLIKEAAQNGQEIYPFMFQPIIGRSNEVSGAIRKLKKEGFLEIAGNDGLGKPFYKKKLRHQTLNHLGM